MWLRNAALMNDFLEVQHGRDCLRASLQSPLRDRLERSINPHHPGLLEEVLQWLNAGDLNARYGTYLTSLAAHESNDEVGQLSMWRAYGGSTAGAALVLNTDFLDGDPSLGAYTSPVLYGDADEFAKEFAKVVANLEQGGDYLPLVSRDQLKGLLFTALQFSVLSTKHKGFREEQEWRVICSPSMHATPFMRADVEVVRGVPQLVYKLRLEDQDGLTMPEKSLDRLLFKIIVGPCLYPVQVVEAFVVLLQELGVPDAHSRVVFSQIPLRQSA